MSHAERRVAPERAAFVDRDGVITELVPDPLTGLPESPLRVSDVALIAGAASGLAALAEAGYLLVGVSNQPAAAKGKVSRVVIEQIQRQLIELLAAEGVDFAAFELCLHHPDGVVAGLGGSCDCRKPFPGMLLRSAVALGVDLERSWMIGDTDADVQAGRAAGCRTALIDHPGSTHKRNQGARPDLRAPDLRAAAAAILVDDSLCSEQ